MKTPLALIVDDEPDILELLSITLGRMRVETHEASTLQEARKRLEENKYDMCLTDLRLPDGDGIELVRHIQATNPALPVAVITAHGNMQTAIEAMLSLVVGAAGWRCRAFLTKSRKVPRSMGLERKSNAPYFIASMAVCILP